MSNVLLISSGFRNPPIGARIQLNRFLKDARYITPEYSGRITEENVKLLAAHDAVVLFFEKEHEVLTPKMEKYLNKFVKRGGGLLVMNPAIGSFKSSETYASLIGIESAGETRTEQFRISPVSEAKRMFSDFPVFNLKDEVRSCRLIEKAKIQMTAEAGGETFPAVWTRKKGDGRVCCITPGCSSETYKSFEYKRLLSSAFTFILKKSTVPDLDLDSDPD